MKKELALVMAIVMMFSFCLSGCDDGSEVNVPDDGNKVVSVDDPLNEQNDLNEEEPGNEEVTDEKDDPKPPVDKDPDKPDDGAAKDPEEEDPPVTPPPAVDRMNWPANEYTALVPKPSAGVVKKTDIQNGIFCLLLTGADMVDAKAYAGSLINSGFTNDVTETIEDGSYLFGGGNSKGAFVVVSYQSGQFIIGIEP
ncbi:MAG: hypothetical protein E7228_00450 [Clostridiales bacterium]|nr:hypothetical protein [Clostridiales bacterium]